MKQYYISRTGGEIRFSYAPSSTVSWTATSETPTTGWFTTGATNGVLSISCGEAVGTDSRSIELNYTVNGVQCNSIKVIQNKACNCEDLVVDLYAIPQSGISDNSIIGTYSIECEDNLLDGEIKYNGTLTNNVTFSNGYIHIVGTIDANTSDYFKEFTFDIKYKNQLCSTYDLSQEGSNVKCDCQSIDYYIQKNHTQFGLDGTSGYEVLIASADTHGCGSLSAKTFNGTVFENDEIRTDNPNDGHYYYWYATVSAVTANSTSTINVYYKKRNESSFEDNCYTPITVECKSSYRFYTCDVITGKQELKYTNGYYDDSYCIYVDNWIVNKPFSSYYGQTVTFKPRFVNDVTESYLSTAKRTYASVPLNSDGVQLNTITVNNSHYSGGTYDVLYDHSLPLVSIGSSNAARKVYFAVDVYVNDMFCFTREGMYVANRSEASLTKCDVIRSYIYKYFGNRTSDSFDRDKYEDWHGNGVDSKGCDGYYGTCGYNYYCFKATPSAFTYDQNGSDVLGDDNWQQIPFDCIFGNNTYAEMLRYTFSNYQCMQGSGLSFDGTLKPQIKLSQPTSVSHYEFEVGDDGYCTNRVRLISGDTSSSYTKDRINFNNYNYGYSVRFGDKEEVFDCSNITFNLDVWLRANKEKSYEDNLDYSSCSALSRDLTVATDAIRLRTTTAQDAWKAGGHITTLRFDYTFPHTEVQLKNIEDDSDVITLNLYWDESSLNAKIKAYYDSQLYRIYPEYSYNTDAIRDAFYALNLCNECQVKDYKIILPSATVITSFTVDTADGSLTCSVNMETTRDNNSNIRYECSNLRSCGDQPITFAIDTPQTYDFDSIVSQGVNVGRFTPITDTQNFRVVASYDSNTPISSFTFNYTTGVIHMVLDSSYRASSAETTQAISVLFAEQMNNCDGEWVTCRNSDTILIKLTNIPTE